MSKYCRASQVNIQDIWCEVTRYFVSRFTANYFDISSGFSRWILRDILSHISLSVTSIFGPASHWEHSRYYVGSLTVFCLSFHS